MNVMRNCGLRPRSLCVGVETMVYNNRELVEFFISYTLSQRNYPHLRPKETGVVTEGVTANSAASNGSLVDTRNKSDESQSSLPPRGGIEAVKAALSVSAEEFELLFTQAYNGLSSRFRITPDMTYQSFKTLMDEVFVDKINWGRIVALFGFGSLLCAECTEKDMSELVPCIIDWMTMYLNEHLNPWIQSHGGWDCFAEIIGENAGAEERRFWQNMRKWLLVTLVVTGVMIAVIMKIW